MKVGKASGPHGITAVMLKYGGEIVVDWMMWICNLAWVQSKVPEDWRKAIIVTLYKGKGNREECNNYRGISLLSVPGKIYGRILNERMMKITDKSVGDEQGGFWKDKGCIDQIFAVKILVEKCLEKDRKLFAAFMDLEKAYDRVDRKGLWDTGIPRRTRVFGSVRLPRSANPRWARLYKRKSEITSSKLLPELVKQLAVANL